MNGRLCGMEKLPPLVSLFLARELDSLRLAPLDSALLGESRGTHTHTHAYTHGSIIGWNREERGEREGIQNFMRTRLLNRKTLE